MVEITDSMKNFTGVAVLTLLFLVSTGVLVAGSHMINRKGKRGFVVCVVILMVVVMADWFNVVVDGQLPELRLAHTLSTALVFSCAPIIPVVIVRAVIPEGYKRPVIIPLALNVLLELASAAGVLGTGAVFWVDAGNLYHRGALYWVYILLYILSSIYLVWESMRAIRVYQTRNGVAMAAIVVCLASGVLMQTLVSAIHTSWTAVAMALLLYFEYYSDTIQQTDPLTMLLNRRGWEYFLEHPQAPVTIVSLDVDRFKDVNDTYGHGEGDECLRTIAREIRKVYGSYGACYRIGGDEFAVVLYHRADELPELSRELDNALEVAKAEDPHISTVSVGWATFEGRDASVAAAVEKADQMMYATKRSRRHGAGSGREARTTEVARPA